MNYQSALEEIVRELSYNQITDRTLGLLRKLYDRRKELLILLLEGEETTLDDIVLRMSQTGLVGPSEVDLLTRQLRTANLQNLVSLVRQVFQLLVDLGHPKLTPYTALFAYLVLRSGATLHFSNIYSRLETGFLDQFIQLTGDSSGTIQRVLSELKHYLSDISQLANVTGLARLFHDLYRMLNTKLDRVKLCQELGINSLLLISTVNPTIGNKIRAYLFQCLRSPGVQPYPISHITQYGLASTLDIKTELFNIQQMVVYIPKIQAQLVDEKESLDLMSVDEFTHEEISKQRQLVANIQGQLQNYQQQVDCLGRVFEQIIRDLVYSS